MTTVAIMLSDLLARGVVLSLAGGELAFRARKGALTAADRATLGERREEIVRYLAASAARRTDPVAIPPCKTLRPSLLQEIWWRWYGLPVRQLDQERLPLIKRYAGVPAARLADALRAVVARHHTLRSSFHEEGGELVVTLNDAEDLPIECIAFDRRHPSDDIEAALRREAAAYTVRQLPLDGEWLLRARIISVSPDTSVLLCVFHHIIVDAASLMLIVGELDARLAKPACALPDTTQFIDYAAWERRWMADPARQPLLDYWARRLRALPALRAPGGRRSLAWRPGRKVDHKFLIPFAQLRQMRAVAASLRTSLFSALVTAFGVALAQWSGDPRFAIRCVGDLRTAAELTRMVGYMICSDIIEINAPPGAAFASLLKANEIELHSAMMLRVPTLMRHPLPAAQPGTGIEDPRGIAATINMFSARLPGGSGDMPAPTSETAWPPVLTRTAGEPWPLPLPSIYLRLVDYGHTMEGSLELNDALLSEAEQAALTSAVFDAIEWGLLRDGALGVAGGASEAA